MTYDPRKDDELEAMYQAYRETCRAADALAEEHRKVDTKARQQWANYVRARDSARKAYDKAHPPATFGHL